MSAKFIIKRLSRDAKIIMERLRGVDFSVMVKPEEVGLDPKFVVHSSPSGNRYLVRLLKDLRITSVDSILDIGSGKGSAMRSMLKFPFARVDGVELSAHIASIAIRNFRKLNVNRSVVFNCDAVMFSHYDRYNIYYFYNPFPAEIMSRVIGKINQAVQGAQREILIIYNNPVCHELVVENGLFNMIKEYPDEWGNKIYVYSSLEPRYCRLSSKRNANAASFIWHS